MEDSILGLDAASLFGEKSNQEGTYLGILNEKIVLISHEALFELIKKTESFWSKNSLSNSDVEDMVCRIEKGKELIFIPNYKLSLNIIKSGLEKAMNGTWNYHKAIDLTTPDHIKKCFISYLKKEDFNKGKAELLMKVILGVHIKEVTEESFQEIEKNKEVRKKETSKVERSQVNTGSHNKIASFFRKKMESLKYSLKNEWEPKYIGGRLVVSQHGNKYKVMAFSTTDSESITVWDKSEAVVKSASWEGSTIVLNCGFGIIHLWGPNNNDY